jgi:peptidoglycan/xylan/chitin deacetylase (PgdA/CDA1 family)
VYPALAAVRRLGPGSFGGQLSIVTYHGLRPKGYISQDPDLDGALVGADAFRAQMRLLKSRYHVISPENLLAWLRHQEPLAPLSVLITCDDGLQNTLTDMLPILLAEDVRCLFFVTGASAEESRATLWYEDMYRLFQAARKDFRIASEGFLLEGRMGSQAERRALWWETVKRLSALDADKRESFLRALSSRLAANGSQKLDERNQTACRRFGLVTAAELKQLAAAGMSIGAHTVHHPLLSQAPPELAYAEIHESKTRLESVLQCPVWAFAYPFGGPDSVTSHILKMPKRAGFEAAFLNFGGGMRTNLPVYALPRVHVSGEMNLAEFDAHVSGLHGRLQRLWRTEPAAPEGMPEAMPQCRGNDE